MHLPILQPHFAAIGQLGEGGIYLLAIGLSQVISNVPATILLLQKSRLPKCWPGGEYRRLWPAAGIAGQPDCAAHGTGRQSVVAFPSVFPADACRSMLCGWLLLQLLR